MMRAVVFALVLSFSPVAFAQDAAPPAENADELAKELSNPIADLTSIPVQLNWDSGVGPDDDLRTVINLQPVVPFKLTPKVNLVGRMIVPFINQPVLAPGGSPASGTGDIVLSLFFMPARSTSKTTWAVGPVFNLPTTSDPALGSGKWGIGPTAIALWSTPHWTYGALVNHLWGLVDTGNVDRGNVSQTFLQPFLARHLPRAMTLTLSSESTYNWHAAGSEAWTVPVNLVVSKVTRLGPFPFSVAGGAGYYVASPSIGPQWKLRVAFTLILPSKK